MEKVKITLQGNDCQQKTSMSISIYQHKLV